MEYCSTAILKMLNEFNFNELMDEISAEQIIHKKLIDYALQTKDKDWFLALTSNFWREIIVADVE